MVNASIEDRERLRSDLLGTTVGIFHQVVHVSTKIDARQAESSRVAQSSGSPVGLNGQCDRLARFDQSCPCNHGGCVGIAYRDVDGFGERDTVPGPLSPLVPPGFRPD